VIWFAMSLALALAMRGADTSKPVVGPGATKEEVIDAYGWPNGQSRSGTKEILTYPQGEITLENGRVEKMGFAPNVPWPAPRARPGPPSPTSVKKVEAPVDFWLTDFEAAKQEAARRHARVLVLFTGSDWSPPSRQFRDEVEFQPDFVNTFAGDFVFLRLDFPTRAPQPRELRAQNAKLRERYGVTTYPTLLVLSAAGTAVGQIDLSKPQAGANYRERVINAVREVRDLLVTNPPPPEPEPEPAAAPAAAPAPSAPPSRLAALAEFISSARALILLAIVLGAAIAGFLWWFLWHRNEAPAKPAIAQRISDAASGLPSPGEQTAWPKEKLCAIVAGLAESDGFVVDDRAAAGDADLALKRAGEAQPRVLVCCAAGANGIVPAKRVRELLATLTAEGVATGWFVAPAGFTPDAKTFAEQNEILLMDGERLLAQLRELPPLILSRVLSRRV